MANKKICRFCSTGFVPQRNELICPVCEKIVVRAVSMPIGEAVVIESPQIKITIPPDVNAELEITEKEVIDEPEPDKPEITKEDVKQAIIETNPDPEIQKAILGDAAPKQEKAPEPVVVEASAPKSAEDNRKQDAEVINPTED